MLVVTPVPTTTAARILVDGVIDYAGLFPPAALELPTTIRNFARYRGGNHGWMLGRFVVPVGQLEAFTTHAEPLLPRDAHAVPWRLTAIGSGDLRTDLNAIAGFNERHQWSVEDRSAVVDSYETRVASLDELARLTDAVLGSGARSWGADRPLAVHAELPIASDPEPLIDALRAPAFHAKVRTGGLSAEAFPQRDHLVRFLAACVRLGVPFKATAGLHHAWRGSYPLTYEAGCASSTMYGFLNVLLAAALLSDGASVDDAARALDDDARLHTTVDDDGVTVFDRRLTRVRLAATRERLALAIGSCSFTEPVDELRALGWL
ncbi:MAG: hypothetical protein MUF00_02200 [Gemmatimonadaceae bacterium]|jgi:hypothetical protein|nr:hypothetical protein [Gemmatimonadaceae bacterium]